MSDLSVRPALVPGRPYRGVSQAERVALRRARLIAAAVALFGTQGYASTSIKAVCVQAGLTERSFYESFGAKEELLQAAYLDCVRRVRGRLTAAAEATPTARMLAGLTAYFGAIHDPAVARIVLFEMDGVSAATDATVRAALHTATDLIRQAICREMPADPRVDLDPELLASGVMGAVFQLAKVWVQSGYARPPEDIVRHCYAIFLGTIAQWRPRLDQ
jgi:AcrR family transcriptional regulator